MTADTSPDDTDDPAGAHGVAGFLTRPPRPVRTVVRLVTAVEIGLGVLALLLIFALVLFQAAQRYLPIDGVPWTGELARFCLVWLTFVVAGVLVSSDSHVSIEMADMIGSDVVRRVVRVVSCLVVAAVGVALSAEALALVDSQAMLRSPAMRMPMSVLYAISLVGFLSTVVRALLAAVRYAVLGVPEPSIDDEGMLLRGVSAE